MKRHQFEKELLDPEGCKKIFARIKEMPQGNSTSEQKTHLRPAPFGRKELPREILAKNNHDFFEKRDALGNLTRFVPEIAKETPVGALKLLMQKCKSAPSRSNQLLLGDAINRVLLQGQRDGETEKFIEDAIKTLGTPVQNAMGEKLMDSIWTRVYQHSDYGGRSYYINHDPGWVYWRVRQSSLNGVDLNDRISSLYVDASNTEVGGKVILFQNDHFNGRFKIFTTTPGNPSARANYSYVGDYMNDRTSSILLVRQFENEFSITITAADLQDQIEDQINSVSGISLRGSPTLTWDMWPGFDSAKRFLYLNIPVTVELDNWWDYDAEIHYWIYLYVDGSGNLGGYVDWYNAWAEGGIFTDSVLDGLMDAIPGTLGDLNDAIESQLALAALLAPYERQYFLPGGGTGSGHTNDGVTLVLVRS